MDKLNNIKNKLLAEQIEEQIYRYIVDTPFPVGKKLPNEFQLAEKFEVSRSTIREAVRLLVSKGILEVRHGAGTYVVGTKFFDEDPLGLQRIDDKIGLAMDLADVRILLEPGIAEIAAIKATNEDIRNLRKLCDIVEQKIIRGEEYMKDDIAFHTAVASCAKNKVFELLIPIIDTAVMMFVNVTHKKLRDETILTHRAVVDAIADRDPVGARSAMMMHMTYNREIIKKLRKETAI